MARLEIDNLHRSFGDDQVLKGVSLSVSSGETVVVFGHSGSGKTALLSLISGALNPDAGDIRVDGESIVTAAPEERNIGMAFQNFALYPHMSAFDNIASPLRGRTGLAADAIATKVRAAGALLRIEHVLTHLPRELSNGQKQRTALARALVTAPPILLLDDPLRNVDAKLRYETRLEMPELFRSSGAAVVYVTQDFREAMALADRVAVLRNGVLEQIASPEEVYETPVSAEVGQLFGDPAMNIFTCTASRRNGTLTTQIGGSEINLGAHADVPDGKHFLAGIRPEHVVIRTDGHDPGGISALLEAVTPTNIRVLTLLRTADGTEIIASCPEDEAIRFERSEIPVQVQFPADRILLFNIDGSRLANQHGDA